MKTNRFSLASILVVMAIVLGAAACTQPPAPQAPVAPAAPAAAPAGAPLILKLAQYQPPTHVYTVTLRKYLPWVEKATNGRVKIEIFDSETLAKGNEFYDAVQRGVADMAVATAVYYSSTFPLFDDQFLPFAYRDIKGNLDAFENGVQDLYIQALHAKGLDKIQAFGTVTGGDRFLITKKPVREPADMKGMKIRGAGSLEMKVIEAGGASAVSTVASEVYEALERGIIDGAMATHSNIVDWRWMETAPNFLNLSVGVQCLQLIYNTDSWAKVADSDKAAVETGIRLGIAAVNQEMLGTQSYRLTSVMPKKMTYNTPNADQLAKWKALAGPLIEGYKQKAGEPGVKLVEIIEKYNQR